MWIIGRETYKNVALALFVKRLFELEADNVEKLGYGRESRKEWKYRNCKNKARFRIEVCIVCIGKGSGHSSRGEGISSKSLAGHVYKKIK